MSAEIAPFIKDQSDHLFERTSNIIKDIENTRVHGRFKIDCEKLIQNRTNKFFIVQRLTEA